MQKQLLLGVEAIAQGAIDGGISGVLRILREPLQQRSRNTFRNRNRLSPVTFTGCGLQTKKLPWKPHWECPMREKEPFGMYETRGNERGCRLFHERCNYRGQRRYLVVIAADDPSMHSSQNEQDSQPRVPVNLP